MNASLEARDLAAQRGTARLFAGLGLRVTAGRALVVTGANGSGKTTLLRILAGLAEPVAGTLLLDGVPLQRFDARLRAAVTYSGHLPALKDELTAEENLASLLGLSGTPVAGAALRDALAAVGLGERSALPARALSQGQRRRIGLARLALSSRPLWLLDEPGAALDADGHHQLASLLHRHLDRGGMAVVATHEPVGLPPALQIELALA